MEFQRFEERIWLASPFMHGEEEQFVQEAFDTNWISTVGRNLDELEKAICTYTGNKHAVALASGTAALHMAVKLAGIGKGDRVFCSDMTFVATVNPVTYEGGEPVFIDSEYDTWNMAPEALERAFEKYPDTKAVIAVNLYGVPARLYEIEEICKRYGAVLIEDAAESLGASYRGKQTGTFGRYNVISFNGNKIITTSGGGMLLTDDEKEAEHVRKWSTQAREQAAWYQHEERGYNYRLSNILAGIGRGQLIHLDEHVAGKEKIYRRYQEGLKNLPVRMNPYMEDMAPNYWLSCIIIDEDVAAGKSADWKQTTPEEIRVKLAEHNAEARPIWKPMHMQPIYEGCDFISVGAGQEAGQKPASEDIFERGLCLPSDLRMTEGQQQKIIEIIRSCFERKA